MNRSGKTNQQQPKRRSDSATDARRRKQSKLGGVVAGRFYRWIEQTITASEATTSSERINGAQGKHIRAESNDHTIKVAYKRTEREHSFNQSS
jgi:hypothetical protein